jgi:HD-like signal output (HDOD) protein
MSGLNEPLHGLDDFPTLPDVALRICDALRDPDVDLSRIAEEVALDPAMAAQLVRLANSAIFGGGSRVDTVQRALLRLGIRATRNAVMTVTLMRALHALPAPFEIRSFWIGGLAAAMTARRIAQDVRFADPEQAYLASLVHDVGMAYLSIQHVDRLKAVLADHQDGEELAYALAHEFGCDLPQISGAVLRHWNFADEITRGVEHHWTPDTAGSAQALAAIVLASDRLTRELKLGVIDWSPVGGSWLADVPPALAALLAEQGGGDLARYLEALRADLGEIESFARSVFPEA